MRLGNMLKICLAFWKSKPQYAYKRYIYKKNMYIKLTEFRHMQDLLVGLCRTILFSAKIDSL